MNILLLSCIMNASCVRLKYHKIEWKIVEVPKYIYIYDDFQ